MIEYNRGPTSTMISNRVHEGEPELENFNLKRERHVSINIARHFSM